jgi:hypothetical protein
MYLLYIHDKIVLAYIKVIFQVIFQAGGVAQVKQLPSKHEVLRFLVFFFILACQKKKKVSFQSKY